MLDYGLSQQQLTVICALSSGATLTGAAQQAGVHRNTITNWRRNLLPFQQALSDAQYDRALYFREQMENLAGDAIETIREILDDPQAPASVRLRAALAVMQTAATPPAPKKQVQLEIEKIVVHRNPTPVSEAGLAPAPPDPSPENAHNDAQSVPLPPSARPAKIGRNEPCPCGSGQKFKRCCLGKPVPQAA